MSVRDMAGNPGTVIGARDAVALGERIGSRVKTAGPILESPRFMKRMQDRNISQDPLETRIGVGAQA